MTDILDELQRLDAEATKGPWTAEFTGPRGMDVPCLLIPKHDGFITGFQREADTDWIETARNALPALVEVARAARGAEDALDAALDDDGHCARCTEGHAALRALRAALARLDGGA